MKTRKPTLSVFILFLSTWLLNTGCNDPVRFETTTSAQTYHLQFLNGTTNEPIFQGEKGQATLAASNFLEMETISLGEFTINDDGFAQVSSSEANSCMTCQLTVRVKGKYYRPQSLSDIYKIYQSDSGSVVLHNWIKGLTKKDTFYYAIKQFGDEHPQFFKQNYPFDELIYTFRARADKKHRLFYAVNQPIEEGYDRVSKKFILDMNMYEQQDITVFGDPELTKIRIME